VSFSSATSWKTIYGFNAGGSTFQKTQFYDALATAASPSGRKKSSVLLERDPGEHSKLRKFLSHAFSLRALAEQETLVRRFVDLLILKLKQHGEKPEGMEMNKWFEYFSFDLMGQLSLGESFRCMEMEEPHYWVEYMVKK
jgi:cytochrome P450